MDKRYPPQYIVLVEDHYDQAELIRTHLELAFADARVERIRTELDFRSRIPNLAVKRPDVIILDVMLKWTDPSPDLEEPPDDVKDEGFHRAGIRCADLLFTYPETRDIPIILYTVLELTDLPDYLSQGRSNVVHLLKESQIEPLIDAIRTLLDGAKVRG